MREWCVPASGTPDESKTEDQNCMQSRFIPEEYPLATHHRHEPSSSAKTILPSSRDGLHSPRVLHVPESPRFIAEECIGMNPTTKEYVLVNTPRSSNPDNSALPAFAESPAASSDALIHQFMSIFGLSQPSNSRPVWQSEFPTVHLPKTPPQAPRPSSQKSCALSPEDEIITVTKSSKPKMTRAARVGDSESSSVPAIGDSSSEMGLSERRQSCDDTGLEAIEKGKSSGVPWPVPLLCPGAQKKVYRGLFQGTKSADESVGHGNRAMKHDVTEAAELCLDGFTDTFDNRQETCDLNCARMQSHAAQVDKAACCNNSAAGSLDATFDEILDLDARATKEVIDFLTVAMDLKSRNSPRSNRSTPFSSPVPKRFRDPIRCLPNQNSSMMPEATFLKCHSAPESGSSFHAVSHTREEDSGAPLYGPAGLQCTGLLKSVDCTSPEHDRPINLMFSSKIGSHSEGSRRQATQWCDEWIDDDRIQIPTSPSGPDAPENSIQFQSGMGMASGELREVTSSPRNAGRRTSDACVDRDGVSLADLPSQLQDQPRSSCSRDHFSGPSPTVCFPRTAILVAGLALLLCWLSSTGGGKLTQLAPWDDAISYGRNSAGKWQEREKPSPDGQSDLGPDLLNTLIFSLLESPSLTEKAEIAMQISASGTIATCANDNLERDGTFMVEAGGNELQSKSTSTSFFSSVKAMTVSACNAMAFDLNMSQLFNLQCWLPGRDAVVGFSCGIVVALTIYARANGLAPYTGLDQRGSDRQMPFGWRGEVEAELVGASWMGANADECPWGVRP